MKLHNTETTYGLVAKSLHWIIGILIIAAWIVGDYMVDIPGRSETKMQLFGLHKSVGMVVLMLAVIRLSWRLYDKAPGISNAHPVLAVAARTVHYLLYALMFIQPLTGWAMSSAAGYNPSFFGLFTFPGIVAKNPESAEMFVALHNTCAILLLVLFVMHVSGALFHHFVLKDNTLRRMTID